MLELGTITLTRKQLYDDIWQMSVAGVARKYNLNYPRLIASCREANIPFPPSGYWTRLNTGKDVSGEVVPLPDSKEENVILYLDGAQFKRRKIEKSTTNKGSKEVKKEENSLTNDGNDSILIGDREKQNKKENDETEKSDADIYKNFLPFLEESERKSVIDKAYSLELRGHSRLHPQLVEYKKSIETYNKQMKELKNRQYYNPRYHKPDQEPLFIKEVSDQGLQRVIAILDALFNAVEELGGKIYKDLSIQIRADIVRVRFVEGQDKVKHDMTKEEAKQLVEYNDAIKWGRYASKPQIRQYANVYNGKLRIILGERKYIRDNDSEKLEERLGEILIALYEKAEETRIIRERREEEERKREEEARRREEIRKRKEFEVLRTKELVNKAEDYKIACEIRQYIQAVATRAEIDEETAEWITWASKKADWFDPIIAAEDEYLGKRKHEKSKEDKALGKEKERYNPYRSWGW